MSSCLWHGACFGFFAGGGGGEAGLGFFMHILLELYYTQAVFYNIWGYLHKTI